MILQGCRFPADAAYRMDIQRDALRVGQVLHEAGVIGRLAVDFICTQADDGSCKHYAIETNLRLGGTTHPMMLLRMLTDGRYDPDTGLYLTPRDEPQFYVATDTMRSPSDRKSCAPNINASSPSRTETVTCPRPQMNATRAARPLDQLRARATAAIGTQWSGAKECNDPMLIAPTARDTKRLVVFMRMLV